MDDNPARVVRIDGSEVRDGFAAIEGMFAVYPEITAVVCCSAPIAMGVYLSCGERGMRIPADLSVVGLDDQPLVLTPSARIDDGVLPAPGDRPVGHRAPG